MKDCLSPSLPTYLSHFLYYQKAKLPLVSLLHYVISCFMLYPCSVFFWNGSFSLNLENLSFKTQLRCHHLQEVFPAYPYSLHSNPGQDSKQDSLVFLHRADQPTLSISSAVSLRFFLYCTRHIILKSLHLHLIIYSQLSTLWTELSFICFHVSSHGNE